MDSDIIIYIVFGLILLIILIMDHKARGGLRQGNNLIHENVYIEGIDELNNEFNYSHYLSYNTRIGTILYTMILSICLISVDLFFIQETSSLLYRSIGFYVGLAILLLSIIMLIERFKQKSNYPNGIMKIGEQGIWTKKLGDVSWLKIKTIIVRVESNVYYLELKKFDNKKDCINMIDIKFDRNKLIDLIENYAEQCFEKHNGLSYWKIDKKNTTE